MSVLMLPRRNPWTRADIESWQREAWPLLLDAWGRAGGYGLTVQAAAEPPLRMTDRMVQSWWRQVLFTGAFDGPVVAGWSRRRRLRSVGGQDAGAHRTGAASGVAARLTARLLVEAGGCPSAVAIVWMGAALVRLRGGHHDLPPGATRPVPTERPYTGLYAPWWTLHAASIEFGLSDWWSKRAGRPHPGGLPEREVDALRFAYWSEFAAYAVRNAQACLRDWRLVHYPQARQQRIRLVVAFDRELAQRGWKRTPLPPPLARSRRQT